MGERSFCSLLERFIRESGHTNFSFAKATGINRVNIQRYVSGGRCRAARFLNRSAPI